MSPFTGDALVMTEFLKEEHKVWKELKGPIASIKIIEKSSDGARSNYKIEIQTNKVEASIKGKEDAYPKCVATFKVGADWSFMKLEKLSVEKLTSTCDW